MATRTTNQIVTGAIDSFSHSMEDLQDRTRDDMQILTSDIEEHMIARLDALLQQIAQLMERVAALEAAIETIASE